MALFFFNLVSPKGYEIDEVGSEFPNVESAYLEARAAAIEMCPDIMRDRFDPTRYQFEIVDDCRRFLMEFPFSEILRPRGVSPGLAQIRPRLQAEIEKARKLCGELRDEIQKSHVTLAQSQKARHLTASPETLGQVDPA